MTPAGTAPIVRRAQGPRLRKDVRMADLEYEVDEGVGTVLVVDPAGQLAGIFSERDLLLRVPDEAAQTGTRPLAEFMTPHPESVRPDDPLALALQKMDVGGYRHLPVVTDGKPIGVISVRDLMRHITRMCAE